MSLRSCIPINCIEISRDFKTSDNAGAGVMFQVCDVTIITDYGSLKPKFDAGRHYDNEVDVVSDLGFDPNKVNFDVVD
ncbi:MAG: hypothetical protein H6Q69_1148 [Firmicutes bacterium]|nr:hypothetical protein [Bacillota bacterium]